jgi:hypothetical protein
MENNISKHISKGNIQVKVKNQLPKPVTRSRNSESYKLYLKGGGHHQTKGGDKKLNIQRKKKENKGSTIRIIKQQDKSSKSKHKFTRKKPSKIKDINEIEKQIELDKKVDVKVDVKVDKKVDVKVDKKVDVKVDTKRSNKRKSKRSMKRSTKRSSKKNVRKISIRKHKKVSEGDIKKVEQKINSIRNKKSSEIKKELEKEGIKVSGKSNRLLKDIYFYSKVCNINIKHE